MTDQTPEPETIPVDFQLGFDEESGSFQMAVVIPGALTVAISVTEAGFDRIDAVLAHLPVLVPELIEQIAEERERMQTEPPAPAPAAREVPAEQLEVRTPAPIGETVIGGQG